MNKEIIISITKNGITSNLWQSETATLLMLNRKTGDKIEFKIL